MQRTWDGTEKLPWLATDTLSECVTPKPVTGIATGTRVTWRGSTGSRTWHSLMQDASDLHCSSSQHSVLFEFVLDLKEIILRVSWPSRNKVQKLRRLSFQQLTNINIFVSHGRPCKSYPCRMETLLHCRASALPQESLLMHGWVGVRRSLLLPPSAIFESEEPLFDGSTLQATSNLVHCPPPGGANLDTSTITIESLSCLVRRAKLSCFHVALKHTWQLNWVAAVLVRIILAKLSKTRKWVCEIGR